MAGVEGAQHRVDALRALLGDFRIAREGVPSLTRPTGAVGAPGTWTGTAADRLHSQEMVPMAGDLAAALDRAEHSILDELHDAERARDHAADAQARSEAEARRAEQERAAAR